LERDYWKGKYNRFVMDSVPEGFSRRQGSGIGLISKYAGLYLKSLFHKPHDRNKSNVYVVKGVTTAEFRRMWGLQQGYEKKSRDNHVHHCIDAITIACISKREYDLMAQYYHDEELHEYGEGRKPHFPKPWPTFTEDVLAIEKELLIVHSTPDVLPKQAKKWVKVKGEKRLAQGDSVRGSLHLDTFYGAIEREGEIKYVVRKSLSTLKDTDVKNIVDDTVRGIVEDAIKLHGFKKAMEGPIYMNKEKGIEIKKVRIYVPTVTKPLNIRNQRDVSRKEYKRQYHVSNDSNYVLAIYEGMVKGNVKRSFELVNKLDAGKFFKRSTDRNDYPDLFPIVSSQGYELKYTLKVGTQVLLWEKKPDEIWELTNEQLKCRLYRVVGLSLKPAGDLTYGLITLRYHQEAKQAKDLKAKNGAFKAYEEHRPLIAMLNTQFNALIEGVDFELTLLGEVKPIKK
jgi:CRISPR-associated endonuclease Csn1